MIRSYVVYMHERTKWSSLNKLTKFEEDVRVLDLEEWVSKCMHICMYANYSMLLAFVLI